MEVAGEAPHGEVANLPLRLNQRPRMGSERVDARCRAGRTDGVVGKDGLCLPRSLSRQRCCGWFARDFQASPVDSSADCIILYQPPGQTKTTLSLVDESRSTSATRLSFAQLLCCHLVPWSPKLPHLDMAATRC